MFKPTQTFPPSTSKTVNIYAHMIMMRTTAHDTKHGRGHVRTQWTCARISTFSHKPQTFKEHTQIALTTFYETMHELDRMKCAPYSYKPPNVTPAVEEPRQGEKEEAILSPVEDSLFVEMIHNMQRKSRRRQRD